MRFQPKLFQETIQNAEDAGASEIQFILDERRFDEKTLINTTPGKSGFGTLQVPPI